MNNIPLTNMAISLSGGGYRATTFHLGALSLLDAIELEAGNKLICDENRREKGATLLENVRIMSTISGGTLTGIMYALKLSQKESFKDCYYKLYDLLAADNLVELALEKLNSPDTWKNKHKSRNVINSFSEVYNEAFFDGATFGDLYKDKDSHLTDAIFGASEFTAGLQYRFQESGSGKFGTGKLRFTKDVSERIRLADAAASSSCFPGGFEPMVMPTDFSNGPETRVEEWWQKKKINFEREATVAQLEFEQASAEVANAIKQDLQLVALAASMSLAIENAAKATKKAEKDAAKVKKATKDSLKAAAKAVAAFNSEIKALKTQAERDAENAKKAIRASLVAAARVGEANGSEKEALQTKSKIAAEKATAAKIASDKSTLAAIKASLQTATRVGEIDSEKGALQTQARIASEVSAVAAQKASEELAIISKQNPKLAALLLKKQEAATLAKEAITIAEKTIKKARKKVETEKKTAKEADAKSKNALQEADKKSKTINRGIDMTTVLKKAEVSATQAENLSTKAKEAAANAAEASANLALILTEKVVECTALSQKLATAALHAEEKAPLLAKAVDAALKAKEEATASVVAAVEAENLTKEVEGQLKTCTEAVSLAEKASTKVAGHTLTQSYESAPAQYGKGIAGKISMKTMSKGKSSDVVAVSKSKEAHEKMETEAAKTKAARKAEAVSAAKEVEAKATAAFIAAQTAANSPALTKEIDFFVSAATQAAAAALAAEEKSVLARNEKQHYPTTAIMDGGILDNQGIRGVSLAEKRYSKEGKKPPFIGTYIISDVSAQTMEPYAVPTFARNSIKDFFTIKRINVMATVLLLGILALLIFVKPQVWGAVVASSFLTLIVLWFAAFFSVRSVFRAKIGDTFAGEDLPEMMKDLKVLVNTPFYIIVHLMMFRATSSMKMISDVFMRRIRSLQINGLKHNWNYRIVYNNIYGLKNADKLTPTLKKVINSANNMPTTLWFTQSEKDDDALNDLIACGQLTLCNSLANYLRGLKTGYTKETVWNQIEGHHQEIDAVLDVVEHYWQNFRVDPYWLINKYKAEQAQHEAERKQGLS